MLVLGIIVVLIAALLVLAAVLGGANDPAAFSIGPLHLSGLNVATVFLLGAFSLLLLLAGLVLLRTGARRAAVRRKETKELGRRSARLEEYEGQSPREKGDPERG